MRTPKLARHMHRRRDMEPIEMSRMEKALIFAAFMPFLMMGLLYIFA
jgi:hypothetical protein